jgi:hypothetical protein
VAVCSDSSEARPPGRPAQGLAPRTSHLAPRTLAPSQFCKRTFVGCSKPAKPTLLFVTFHLQQTSAMNTTRPLGRVPTMLASRPLTAPTNNTNLDNNNLALLRETFTQLHRRRRLSRWLRSRVEEILGGLALLVLVAAFGTESNRSRTREIGSFERSFGYFRREHRGCK